MAATVGRAKIQSSAIDSATREYLRSQAGKDLEHQMGRAEVARLVLGFRIKNTLLSEVAGDMGVTVSADPLERGFSMMGSDDAYRQAGFSTQDLVEASQDHQIGLGRLQGLEEDALALGPPRERRPIGQAHGHTSHLGTADRRRVSPVAPDQHDTRGKIRIWSRFSFVSSISHHWVSLGSSRHIAPRLRKNTSRRCWVSVAFRRSGCNRRRVTSSLS